MTYALTDRDRIFANLYGMHDRTLRGAMARGDWEATTSLLAKGRNWVGQFSVTMSAPPPGQTSVAINSPDHKNGIRSKTPETPLTFPPWEAPFVVASDKTKEALVQFHIENMTCGGCVRGVTRAIHSVDPGAAVEADPRARKLTVQSIKPGAEFLPALAAAGFDAKIQ